MNKNNIPSQLKGLFIGFLITAFVFIVYCALITYTSITDRHIRSVVMITTAVSVIAGGFASTGSSTSKGWLCGLLDGFMYALIIISIGFTINPELHFNSKIVGIAVISLVGGTIGGILGINLKNVCK